MHDGAVIGLQQLEAAAAAAPQPSGPMASEVLHARVAATRTADDDAGKPYVEYLINVWAARMGGDAELSDDDAGPRSAMPRHVSSPTPGTRRHSVTPHVDTATEPAKWHVVRRYREVLKFRDHVRKLRKASGLGQLASKLPGKTFVSSKLDPDRTAARRVAIDGLLSELSIDPDMFDSPLLIAFLKDGAVPGSGTLSAADTTPKSAPAAARVTVAAAVARAPDGSRAGAGGESESPRHAVVEAPGGSAGAGEGANVVGGASSSDRASDGASRVEPVSTRGDGITIREARNGDSSGDKPTTDPHSATYEDELAASDDAAGSDNVDEGVSSSPLSAPQTRASGMAGGPPSAKADVVAPDTVLADRRNLPVDGADDRESEFFRAMAARHAEADAALKKKEEDELAAMEEDERAEVLAKRDKDVKHERRKTQLLTHHLAGQYGSSNGKAALAGGRARGRGRGRGGRGSSRGRRHTVAVTGGHGEAAPSAE